MSGRLPRVAIALATGGLLVGCTPELAPIRLDISKNCNEVDVVVITSAVGGAAGQQDEIVHTAADGSAPNSAWVLYVPAAGAAGNLRVRHLVGDNVVSDVEIGIPAQDKFATRLRASPIADEVFVTREGIGDFRLWRVIERDPLPYVQGSNQLGNFPNDGHTCSPCDTADWKRDLIFLQGEPYLVSVPPFSPTVAISVWVGALTAGQNGIGDYQLDSEHRLNFEPRCDPGLPLEELQSCESTNAIVSHPTVEVLGRQIDPRPATSAILATRGRQEAGIPLTTHDIFVVHVGLDDDNVPAGILRSEQSDIETTRPPGPPSGLAVDEFATYAMVNMPIEGVKLLRLELATFDQGFTTLSVPDLEGQSLLQLDNDIALGRINDGAWEITKLFPDSVEQSRTTTYESSAPIVAAEAAGPGVFLLRRDGASPELVRLACASAEIPPGE